MKYDIYIKGCYGREDNSASLALAVVSDDKAVEKKSAKFDNEIPTKEGIPIPILQNKGQYQMEVYALAWALTLIADSEAEFVVYSNNQAVVGWFNKWEVPEDYRKIFSLCRRMIRDRKISSKWIPKKTDSRWNELVNDVAFELIQMKGSPITKIF